MFADDTRLGGVADTPDSHSAVPVEINSLEKWAHSHLMQLNKGEAQSPAPGKKPPHAPIHAGGHRAGKQLGRKGSEGPARYQMEHEPTMRPCCREGTWYPGLHQVTYCQQVKGGDPSTSFSASEATHGVLCPLLAFPVQQRDGHTRESPIKV